MSVTVANASPLIALAKIDHFSILRQLFQSVIVPAAVWEEVVVQGAGKPAAVEAVAAEKDGWLQRHIVKDTLAVTVLEATLGAGESEAIMLAQELRASWLLLDDDLARTHAKRLDLSVKGTAGILLAAHVAGIELDLRAALDELRAKGFRLNDRIYQAVLAAAGLGE